LRGKHLLVKVDELIQEADLSLFDLTRHNPNVAVEFGLAYARGVKWALLYSTSTKFRVRTINKSRVFSDLQGMDSIPYSDYVVLEHELRRLLPEYLAARYRAPRTGGVNGSSHDSAIRPRLDASVRPVYGRSVTTLGSGHRVVKMGDDTLNVTLSNDGSGAANAVVITITGFDFIDHIESITRSHPVSRKWPLEGQPAYQNAPPEPAITVRYGDDNGDKYEQVGRLKALPSGPRFYYSGTGLGPPRPLA
jgi:hypothetical protein